MRPPKLNSVEPPRYGSVCQVVWEGRCREASPYPDQSLRESAVATAGITHGTFSEAAESGSAQQRGDFSRIQRKALDQSVGDPLDDVPRIGEFGVRYGFEFGDPCAGGLRRP
jgi:hypothetical protein